jgi:hypothetical protein
MTQSTSAALHILGPTIRYVEVVREGEAQDLRRLGARTFPFDVARALWGEEGSDDLDRVAEAVQSVFSGLDAAALRVVVNPPDVFSFFIPIPVGVSDAERRRYATAQTALVTGVRSPDTLTLSLQSIRPLEGNDTIEWVHVLALPQEVAERMDTLTDSLPVQDVSRMVSSQAAARVVGQRERSNPSSAENGDNYSLAIGQYATHTEYVLLRDGSWHHAHAAQEARSSANRAYYAVGFLNRVGLAVQAVDHLFVYGPRAAAEGPWETVFGSRPVLLDPFETLRRVPDRFEKPNGAEEYVPCIGGALNSPG